LDDGAERPAGFAVIAYGKLGGLELSYRSDLDLVFVHDSAGEQQATRGAKSVHNQVFFTRLAQRLIHLLTTPTAGGIVYEIDVRLRPSGASGLIVTSLEAFAEYQARSAWTWEHQALVRARFVAGDPCVRSGFERIRAEVLRRRRDPVGLAKDVREMRAKMLRENKPPPAGRFDIKRGEGGITDIEFMVQYAVLRWAHDYPDLVEFTDNLRLLARIEHNGCLAPETCRQLHEAYFTLRREIHRLALLDEPALVDGERFAAERAAVRRWWRAVFESDAEHCA
jgi:glutamate-ammonia-ligase adenylyltransferase